MRRSLGKAFPVGLTVLAVFAAWSEPSGALEEKKGSRPESDSAAKKPYGLQKRVLWTASTIRGTPDPPPPYQVVVAFPHLKFKQPIEITGAPGLDRLFVAEASGQVYSYPNKPRAEKTDLCLDLVEKEPRTIYGMTFHPKFEENRYVFVCYTLGGLFANVGPEGTRVSRFRMAELDPPRIDPKTEKILITWRAGGHNGGCVKFGPDGYLYISTGDGPAAQPDGDHTGQDLTDLRASILRIDVNHPDKGRAYGIPADNPFVKLAGARPEVWAYGFRNPWRMSFDPFTGDLLVGDVGWELWEWIVRAEPGGNYGWSVMEGRFPVNPDRKRGPTPILPPLKDHDHSEAVSITGGIVYRGNRLPELTGAYIYGDFGTTKIWGLRYEKNEITWFQELMTSKLKISSFGEDNAGELYILDYETTKQIYRLVRNPASGKKSSFPRKLSETGIFSSLESGEPAPGVIPYSIRASLWSDHVVAERFLALPGDSRIGFRPDQPWTFPRGAVLVKTLSVDLRHGDPSSRRRLETQILHFEENTWRPYSYVWNEDQSDATLLETKGMARYLSVEDPAVPGGVRKQRWYFAGRDQCYLCHRGQTIGVGAAQWNRDHAYGAITDNQFRTLAHIGVFDNPPPEPDLLARLTGPRDSSADLDDRVRAYLDVQCAHCHRPNAGGNTSISLGHDRSLQNTGTVNVHPIHGAFGIADARLIVPGDPYRSLLFYRMATQGHGRMPRLGSYLVDEEFLGLIHDWIVSLPTKGGSAAEAAAEYEAALRELRTASVDDREQRIERMLSSVRESLMLVRMLDGERLSPEISEQALGLVEDHAAEGVWSLFERFLPPSELAGELGDVIHASDILSLPGNVRRGEEVFWKSSSAQCKNCHRINGVGVTVGPDLSQIGKKYGRSQLLDQLLDPSKEMAPEFVPYLLQTKKGRILIGFVAKKDQQQVVIRDGQGTLTRVRAEDVEMLTPQKKSLMPDLLLRHMTAQDVADLLDYLVSLR